MKKLFAFLMCVLMLLALMSGCAKSDGEEVASGVFTVGYGQADISPTWSIYLRGYGEPKDERMSTGVSDPIYVNCVAFTDEDGKTILFLSADLLLAYRDVIRPVREAIAEATGVCPSAPIRSSILRAIPEGAGRRRRIPRILPPCVR